MPGEAEDTGALQGAKAAVRGFHAAMDAAAPGEAAAVMAACHAPDHLWRGFHPFHEIAEPGAVGERFWAPLKAALPCLRHRLDLFFAGRNEIDGFQAAWVGTMGHLMGLFDGPWLGIAPTRKIAMLPFAAFHRVEDGAIAETAMFFDLPHFMQQAGRNPFGAQTGASLVRPGPAGHDGLLLDPQDPAEGKRTLDAINAMIGDLASWSGGRTEPLVDELRRTWNEDMAWWGPAGIGATFTVPRYAEQHSGPFREAFGERTFNGHLCKIAEGRFGGFFGWPNLTLTHRGGFMGMPATGKAADMRVIDMYGRGGDKLSENWIFIDLLHFWNMQGVDLLARATGGLRP